MKDSKAAVAWVRNAVAAKPGDVRALVAEVEGGEVVCEVEVLAQARSSSSSLKAGKRPGAGVSWLT